MRITTPHDAREIGISNAVAALDFLTDPFYADSVASYRQNVIDTIDELNAIDHQAEALAAFDAHVAKWLVSKLPAAKVAEFRQSQNPIVWIDDNIIDPRGLERSWPLRDALETALENQ